MSYLLDTNVFLEIVRVKPEEKVLNWFSSLASETLYISVLTLGAIRKGVELLVESKRKEKLRFWLETELTEWFNGRILNVDNAVADRWGRIQSEAKRPLSAVDSLLAATALQYDLRLVTRNTQDFQIPSLIVFNPWAAC